jgi:hypothetical protein
MRRLEHQMELILPSTTGRTMSESGISMVFMDHLLARGIFTLVRTTSAAIT